MMLFINKMFYCCNLKIKFDMKILIFNSFFVVKMTERRKKQSEEWTYFTLFIYFITVNTYRLSGT